MFIGCDFQALAGTDLQQQQNHQKKPKTIHRCILQRVSKPKGGASPSLKCHVCDVGYSSYPKYYQHLIDSTCLNQKKAKDLAALSSNVPTVILSPEVVSPGFQKSPGFLKQTILPKPAFRRAVTINGSNLHERRRELNQMPSLEPIIVLPDSRKRRISDGSDQSVSPPENDRFRPEIIEEPEVDSGCETPLNLSTNETEQKSVENLSLPKLLPLKKRRSSAGLSSPEVIPEVAPEVIEVSKKCPHQEAESLSKLSMIDHAGDQTKMANLKQQLTSLLVSLLGEKRLGEMGYPDTDILKLLKSVLEAARGQVSTAEDDCAKENEKCKHDSGSTQVKYRLARREIEDSRINIRRLLEICVPNDSIWTKYGWKSKSVEDILFDIQIRGFGSIGETVIRE